MLNYINKYENIYIDKSVVKYIINVYGYDYMNTVFNNIECVKITVDAFYCKNWIFHKFKFKNNYF